jgi:chromosome segregation ATPase
MMKNSRTNEEVKELFDNINTIPGINLKQEKIYSISKANVLFDSLLKVVQTLGLTDYSREYQRVHARNANEASFKLSKLEFEPKFKIVNEVFEFVFKKEPISREKFLDPSLATYFNCFNRLWKYHKKIESLLTRDESLINEISKSVELIHDLKNKISAEAKETVEIEETNAKFTDKSARISASINELCELKKDFERKREKMASQIQMKATLNEVHDQQLAFESAKLVENEQILEDLRSRLIPNHSSIRMRNNELLVEINTLKQASREVERQNEHLAKSIANCTSVTFYLSKFEADGNELNVKVRNYKEIETQLTSQQRVIEGKVKSNESLKKEIASFTLAIKEQQNTSEVARVEVENRIARLRKEKDDVERVITQKEITLRRISNELSEVEQFCLKTTHEIESMQLEKENAFLDFKNFSREIRDKRNEYEGLIVEGVRDSTLENLRC